MKKSSLAGSKKVSQENLARLGADLLAEILVEVADTRPDLKRRLRMELAARLGPEHLAPDIDKRLLSLETSRGEVRWRQKPSVIRDLGALRGLIADRLAALDLAGAVERLWRFMATASVVMQRFPGGDAAVAAIYLQAAGDLGRLLVSYDPRTAANALMEAMRKDPRGWAEWLGAMFEHAPQAIAELALHLIVEAGARPPGGAGVVRALADAALNPDAYRATYPPTSLTTPSVAVEVARRYLAVDQVEVAGDVLRAAAPRSKRRNGPLPAPDFDWEGVWIDYLDRSGQNEAGQAVRWASFERTLSEERLRAFVRHLPDFDDVEAEGRAFRLAAIHPDFQRGLAFLMAWPALPEAAEMIEARAGEIEAPPAEAELWAAKLRRRHPAAAHALLRAAAARAFQRREFKTCDHLTQEAETIAL